jgi:group I intron endonuclease
MKNIISYLPNRNKYSIYEENRNKSGIYRWNDLTNNKSYIGSSKNLTNRFYTYYSSTSMKNIIKKSSSRIYSAILRHGHTKFSLDILEYCDSNTRYKREQYYINLLKPEYNILKRVRSNFRRKISKKIYN